MSTRKSSPWSRRVAALAAFIAVLVVAGLSSAAGRVQWKKTTVQENTDSKSWKLEMKIFLPKAPDVAHVPVKFEFGPIAYYERAMLDGDKLKERRVPLEGRQDIIQGVEIGFLDPSSGKIEKGTSFSFKITRALGFEAGEYRVSIRDTRNGQLLGAPITLKLEGENEIIDRRAMVFADPKDKKKNGEKKQEASEEKKEEASEEKKEEPEEASEEKSDEPVEKAEDKPGEVKEKPGGCGCRLADSRGTDATALVAGLLGIGLLGARRRRARVT